MAFLTFLLAGAMTAWKYNICLYITCHPSVLQSFFHFIIMALLLAAGITLAVKSRKNKKSFSFIGGILLASWPIAIILSAFVATLREQTILYSYRR